MLLDKHREDSGKDESQVAQERKEWRGLRCVGAFFIEARVKVNTFIHKRENRFLKLCPAPTYCAYPHSTHCPPAFEQTFSFPVTWTRPRQWVCTFFLSFFFFSKPAITLGHQQQNNGWKVTMERQTVWFKTATVRGERERRKRWGSSQTSEGLLCAVCQRALGALCFRVSRGTESRTDCSPLRTRCMEKLINATGSIRINIWRC